VYTKEPRSKSVTGLKDTMAIVKPYKYSMRLKMIDLLDLL